MTTEQLKGLLSDMADEVKPISVHQRAAVQSKRIAMVRATAASIATLALVGGTIVGFTAFADGGTADNQQSADDNGLPTSEVDKLEGTFYEGTFQQGPGGEALRSWETGDGKASQTVEKGTDDGYYYHTGAVSPDGKYVAYLTDSPEYASDPENGNKIKIRNLETGKISEVGEYSGLEKTCSEPTWAPDGRLFVDRGTEFDDRTGFIDAETGKFSPFAVDKPCDVRVGEGDRVYSTAKSEDGTVDVYVTEPGGARTSTGVGKLLNKEEDNGIRELVAVSPDGRFMCINPGGDEYADSMNSRFNFCDLVIDTQTEKKIEFDGIEGVPETEAGETEEYDVVAGSPSIFAVPGRLIVEKTTSSPETDDSREKQQMYDYEGKLIDEVDSATAKEDEEVLAFIPK